MNPKSTIETLNRFLYHGYGGGLFTHVVNHSFRETSMGIFSIGPIQDIGMIATSGLTFEEYLELISNQRYSAILYDYSLLCIECQITNGEISRHRYMYIPCPLRNDVVAGRPDEIEVADFLSQVDRATLNEKMLSQGYFRFDFTNNPSPKGIYHPQSHLTLMSPDCRIGLKSPISISEFLTFIFDNFYPNSSKLWLDYQPHLKVICKETIREEESSRMHLYWADET